MLHTFPRQFRIEDFASDPLPRAANSVLPPLTAADYLRLRREAAGITIEQAAARIAPRDMVDIAERLLRDLARPGTVARFTHTLLRISYAFPFDLGVYRLLAEQPADRHPSVCRGCGATAADDTGPLGDAVRMVSRTSCAACDHGALVKRVVR
jgi:hypothetical protein